MAYIDTANILDPFQPGQILRNHGATLANKLDAAHCTIERVFDHHALRLARQGTALRFAHRSAQLSALTLNLISYGAEVEVEVDWLDRPLYIMIIPLDGVAEVSHGPHCAAINRGSYIILDPDQKFRFRMDAAHSHLAVGIPHRVLNRFVKSNDIVDKGGKLRFSYLPKAVGDADHGLFDFLGFLCREVDRPRTCPQVLGTQEALQESFFRLLLSSTLQGDGTERRLSQSGIAPHSVRLAEKFMQEHIKDDISVDDIARAAGVSARALGYNFRMFRDTSPMQWLKRERLVRAHADLAAPGQECSVTQVALRYCSSNPGRFAYAYFLEFGEYPSDTLRKRSLPALGAT